ncbi:TOMM precursor leader peptide-binding protein [Thalassospira marina]|uniref:Adenylate cyclase n=1 Tax=Thalassospira marina TaxID=2048283 RepID=A0ABN5FSY5_9PROT|nr:TOMM precursor leader peptide-binding protein [Thalassospira marina]AUG55579.1 adenylate cyclase [Thalassospira marina]
MPDVKKPRIKPYFHVQVLPPEGVYLLSETGSIILKGERNCALIPLMDGTRTIDDIAETVQDQCSFAEVLYVVDMLHEKQYIDDASTAGNSADRNFWQALTLEPETARQKLAATKVRVVTLGQAQAAPFISALATFNIAVTQEDNWDMGVVITDDYLHSGMEAFNKQALAAGKPWIAVKPHGVISWVGPVFKPSEGGCWACLAQRLRLNREVDTYLQNSFDQKNPFPISRAFNGASVEIGIQLAALQTAKWIAGGIENSNSGKMFTLNMLNLHASHHTLVPRPQCPVCGCGDGDVGEMPAAPTLSHRAKTYTVDGGHRAKSPQQLLNDFSHHISPYIGAVRELEKMDEGLHEILPAYGAGHNFAVRTINLTFLRRGLRTRSAGKGTTDTQAKASALAEALERYSGLYFGNENRITASYAELGSRAIHPNDCMLYSDQQYEDRDAWNSRDLKFAVVPQRFDENASIEWSPVWSITENRYKYLPTGYLYYNYPLGNDFQYWADSNGNAAGTCLEDAILQGAMELVERDAVAMWWYNRFQRPALDLDSFQDDYVNKLRQKYKELNRPLWVLDITNDLGIPTFVAVSRRIDKPCEDILCAFGSHYDPRLALRRALTEMNQFLHAVVDMKADGSGTYRFPEDENHHWWKTATLENQPYLAPLPNSPLRRLQDFPIREHDDLLEDVLAFQELIEDRGMELLFLDQTRPDIDLPVVKVIVPGLRHFWARYAPGRLFTVPVTLGWQERELAEHELNPIPCFL